MDHDIYDDACLNCSLCDEPCGFYELCSCCDRCIDCVAEAGHARTRVVADEIEDFNERVV